MIFEVARIMVDPERAAAFEEAVANARAVFHAAEGCRGIALERVVETRGAYNLRVAWQSIEHHVVTFRQSEGFQQWRAMAGAFFLSPPIVQHVEIVAGDSWNTSET